MFKRFVFWGENIVNIYFFVAYLESLSNVVLRFLN